MAMKVRTNFRAWPPNLVDADGDVVFGLYADVDYVKGHDHGRDRDADKARDRDRQVELGGDAGFAMMVTMMRASAMMTMMTMAVTVAIRMVQ